jgi:hypothetical protein
MRTRYIKRLLATVASFVLIAAISPGTPGDELGGGAADSAAMSRKQLQSLVAPIALYPDPLVAQILSAATFPDQVAVANYWLQEHKGLSGGTLMENVNRESWNASIKALTEFPTVLDNMGNNLNWTSTLGEAYHNQASEVMAAIQTLRAQAKAAGHLQSGPQITVTQESPQIITIEPTNSQMVYVPEYNPAVVYGTPYVTPGYTAGAAATGTLPGFGSGVAVGALTGGCCGWGWGSWNANWNGGAVAYNHNNFYGNTGWHGGYYNGAYHHGYGYDNAYNRALAHNAYENRGYAARAGDWNRSLGHGWGGADSWAKAGQDFRHSNAFSGFGNRGFGGWQSRADSFRGWGSMRSGGFHGGRFGGGRFGGGGFRGFHGGGFHRR